MANAIYAGDAGAFKICKKCGEIKSTALFHPDKAGAFSVRPECRACNNALRYERVKKNPERQQTHIKRWRERNKDKVQAHNRKHYENNKEAVNTRATDWAKANPNARREVARRWLSKNPEKQQEYNARRRSTPKGRLEDAIRAGVWGAIRRGGKHGRRTFELLGYTPSALMAHLEGQFLPGMTWENYGKGGWNVDHIIPLSAHHYETPDDIDFKKAWALTNLQPLWEADNIRKHAKLSAPFQPSLTLRVGATDG